MDLKFLIILYTCYLCILIKLIDCDCGLPAIPFNAQINKVQQIFYEGESVVYQCQLEDLKLIGNNTRKCVDSQWQGTIPKCVEELNNGIISVIDLADRRNDTLNIRGDWYNRDSTAAYFADPLKDHCLKSSKMSRPHSWKIHLTKAQRHISYLEIVIYDKYKVLAKTDITKIIKYAKINELRECAPQLVERADTSIRLSLTCLMEFDGDSKYEAWERDITQMITIEFNVDDITICEIRIFTNSFMPFHRCGSADIVLHSTMDFIEKSEKYGRDTYYNYKCDDGFELVGSPDVRCGLNNHWLDPFPTCKPSITCPYPPPSQESITVEIGFEHMFSFAGNMTAVVGSVITFRCIADLNNNSIMIGDSVRLCGKDGKWTGIEPMCILHNQLTAELYEDLIKNNDTTNNLATLHLFNSVINDTNRRSLGCGVPAMPLLAKPTSSKRFRLFGSQADLRLWYENGTKIYYQCESAYRWVTGDVDSRTCVNGKWIGKVGKCAINWGNKIRLYSIYVYDVDKNKIWINRHRVLETNDTSLWDEHFAYRRDVEKGECATFTVDSRHKWVLRLNQSTLITYFVVMLHPGGFFGKKRRIRDPKILDTSPVTAEVGKRQCVLTSAWDYSHSRAGSFFFFTCDMDEPKYRFQTYERYINIYIDPNKFINTYKSKNISLCSLAVMASKEDCGTPDVPQHSFVSYDSNTHEWTYTCDSGYVMVGSPKVSCGRNGRWAGDFPTCVKQDLCPMKGSPRDLIIDYQNLAKSGDKSFATLDSLAKYSCFLRPNDKQVLIGSSLSSCTKSGQWSGGHPICIDPSTLPKSQTNKESYSSLSVGTIFAITILTIVGVVGIIGGLYYAYISGTLKMPKMRMPDLTIPKINIQRPTSVATPNIYENAQEVTEQQSQQSAPKSYKINEDMPAFSKGNEFLVEPDSEA